MTIKSDMTRIDKKGGWCAQEDMSTNTVFHGHNRRWWIPFLKKKNFIEYIIGSLIISYGGYYTSAVKVTGLLGMLGTKSK